jgi:hypothetical protein
MRVLFACLAALAVPAAAHADPVELTGRFLIERDAIAALPGAPAATDAVPGGQILGTWVVDAGSMTHHALTGGPADPVPYASGFTVSADGQALYGEVMSHSRVTGQDAPAGGATGDRVLVDAFAPGAAAGDLDAMRLVLTGPADWFETTAPGVMPDLSRATVTFEGRMLRGGQVVQERSGRAVDTVTLRRIATALRAAGPGTSEPDATLFGV